jgi:exopolysaccharide biosynthesis protein
MQKANSKHVIVINNLMLKTTESYINTFVSEDENISSISMYAEDVAHNVNALVNFNATKDAQALHDSIMLQDTLVREYYIEVLRYIESNKLISADNYCCI